MQKINIRGEFERLTYKKEHTLLNLFSCFQVIVYFPYEGLRLYCSLKEASKNFSLNSITKQPSNQFDPNDFEIRQCWGATYKGHEWLMEHNHFPWTLSFVYYVSMPKGASGLMMGDDEIEMYEGDCIFFLGSQYHGVRPSHTMNDTRCVIAGNILYVQS